MDSNAFLLTFGMDPEDFGRTEGPIKSDEGFVYEGREARKAPVYPNCGSAACIIHNRYDMEARVRSDLLKKEIFICHRIRYSCKSDNGNIRITKWGNIRVTNLGNKA